jgi:hypothetical protein
MPKVPWLDERPHHPAGVGVADAVPDVFGTHEQEAPIAHDHISVRQ